MRRLRCPMRCLHISLLHCHECFCSSCFSQAFDVPRALDLLVSLSISGSIVLFFIPNHSMSLCQSIVDREERTMTWLNEWLKEQIPSYKQALTHVDPRTKDWFLLWADPVPAVTLALIYLLIVTLGPRYMKHREAFHVPSSILFVYNMALVVLSAYMVEEVRGDEDISSLISSICSSSR